MNSAAVTSSSFRYATLLVLSAAAAACVAAGDANRPLELQYLRAVVSPDLLDYASIEVPGLDNLRIGQEGGRDYLALRNFFGQKVKNNGTRAEVSIDYPFREGQTFVYSWKFKIPNDFQSDAPRNRWWLIADWHDQPDRNRGETWERFPGHSPPIGIGYGQPDGRDSISLFYGSPDSRTIGVIPIQRGSWQSIAVRITWSRGPAGRVALSMNGSATPVLQASGPNMHNDFQHFLKIGSYRHPEIRGDSWIWLRELAISAVPQPADSAR